MTIPGCLIGKSDDLIVTDLSIEGDKIVEGGGQDIEMDRSMILPCFVDMHTHLDKGHIWPRAANPDGTFDGALNTVSEDREANWSAKDVHTRMEFSLKCALAHGTRAIRTHLDSPAPQDEISWPVFTEVRADWADRIELQASSLVGCDRFDSIKD